MERQSSTPGPGIGWAFGAAGFLATVLVGRLLSAGTGFVLFMVVFWVGLGALFAFLVERSTIEEQDRAEELHNTRLATLDPVRQPARAAAAAAEPAGDPRSAEEREAARRAADDFAAAVIAAVPLGTGSENDRTAAEGADPVAVDGTDVSEPVDRVESAAAHSVAPAADGHDEPAAADPSAPAADGAPTTDPAPADASPPDRDRRRTRKVRGYRTTPADPTHEDHAAA